MKLKSLVIALILVFWPIGLVLHSPSSEIVSFVAPAILLALALKYYKCEAPYNSLKKICYWGNSWYYIIPLLIIPFISPKLSLFPVLFSLADGVLKKFSKKSLIFLVLSLLVLFIQWHQFYGQTVFIPDYEAQQKVIRDQKLYPTPFTARLFHNKLRIVLDKFSDNFFALIDPNNYLFGFAPRQIVGNQNLNKFPFLSLPFMFVGLYHLKKNKDKDFIVVSSVAALISLSLLTIFDRNDFILFIPILLLTIHGLLALDKKYKSKIKYYYIVFISFSAIELLRILIPS